MDITGHQTDTVPMEVDYEYGHPSGRQVPDFPMHANRTKPTLNKYQQKRLGAKKAKKLELEENVEGILSPNEATAYRALSARCNYLAQDRPGVTIWPRSCVVNSVYPTRIPTAS